MRQLLLQISYSSNRAGGKRKKKKHKTPKQPKIYFYFTIALDKPQSSKCKRQILEERWTSRRKRNHRILKKSRRVRLQEQHLITKVTFPFESMTSSARNASSIVPCHMEVVKNWSKTFSNAALKNFSLANTVFQSWH